MPGWSSAGLTVRAVGYGGLPVVANRPPEEDVSERDHRNFEYDYDGLVEGNASFSKEDLDGRG